MVKENVFEDESQEESEGIEENEEEGIDTPVEDSPALDDMLENLLYKEQFSDEEIQECLPQAFADYEKARTEAESYSEDDPSHEIIQGKREALERQVKDIKNGREESWKAERFLAHLAGNSDDIRKVHEQHERLENFEDWVNKAEKEGKISPETADSGYRMDLHHSKAKLNRTASMLSTGLSWDDIGKASDGAANMLDYAKCPGLEDLVETARDVPFEVREELYDHAVEDGVIDEKTMDYLRDRYLPEGFKKDW